MIFRDQFWVTINGNFIDICIIEWCKLFGDTRGKHYWGKVITEKDKFLTGLLGSLNITEDELTTYVYSVKEYRDKFVAHLDSENVAYLPMLDIAKNSTIYLYDYLLKFEDKEGCFPDAPKKGADFFERMSIEGKAIYNK